MLQVGKQSRVSGISSADSYLKCSMHSFGSMRFAVAADGPVLQRGVFPLVNNTAQAHVEACVLCCCVCGCGQGTHLAKGVVMCVWDTALGTLLRNNLGDCGVVHEGDGWEQVVLNLVGVGRGSVLSVPGSAPICRLFQSHTLHAGLWSA